MKPALLRVAPLLLVACAGYSLLWVVVLLASGPDLSYSVVGVELSWRESLLRALPVDVLGLLAELALALGLWLDRPWARALAVWSPSGLLAVQLLLLPHFAPARALVPAVAACAALTAGAFCYLYRKRDVVAYYVQVKRRSARESGYSA